MLYTSNKRMVNKYILYREKSVKLLFPMDKMS